MVDLQKVWLIIRKDLELTFSDRGNLLLMFAAPIALSFIIGAAFSGFIGTNDVPIRNIQVAIVNEDQGASVLLQKLNYGQIVTDIFVPPSGKPVDPNNTLYKLLSARSMTRDEATAAVDRGDVVAAIFIPPTFSESLNPLNKRPAPAEITLYRDAGANITASVVSSIIRSVVTQIASGTVTIYAAGDVDPLLKARGQELSQNTVKILTETPPIRLQEQTITGQQAVTFDPLQYFPPAMAVFFLTFTAAGSATGVIEERENWTMQRMVTTPTTALTILLGKLGAVFVAGCIQVAVLIAAMAFIAPILGSPRAVWGTNIPGLILMTLCTVTAATGLGTLLIGVARTSEQANTYGNALLALLGMLGGAFFSVSAIPVLRDLTKLTLNYWGTSGFATLARTNNLADVLPNLVVLLLFGLVTFGIGAILTSRKLATG